MFIFQTRRIDYFEDFLGTKIQINSISSKYYNDSFPMHSPSLLYKQENLPIRSSNQIVLTSRQIREFDLRTFVSVTNSEIVS